MANTKKMTRDELFQAAAKAKSICFNVQAAVGEFGLYTTIITRAQFQNMMKHMQFQEFYADVIGDALYIGKQ